MMLLESIEIDQYLDERLDRIRVSSNRHERDPDVIVNGDLTSGDFSVQSSGLSELNVLDGLKSDCDDVS